jgi:isopentenyl diphosphate isomerase/L-lactate dehydrogenase-like FMN-dependent dehydrogenase
VALREGRVEPPVYLGPDELARLFSVEEFEPLARERMVDSAYRYVAGWAGTGETVRLNREAFGRWVFRPRGLVDVSSIDPSTTVLGQPVSLPVLFAPSALHRLAHPEGELATASASVTASTIMIMSTSASSTIEDVAAVARDPWFQLYWLTDRELTRDLVQRAAAAGFRALCLTVDAPVGGWRESELRYPVPINEDCRAANLPDEVEVETRLTWSSLEWLRSISPLPLVLKGIMTAEDARLAVEHGADAIVVSNHGGRQLDWAQASLEAMPVIVDAVDGRLEILTDGGIRRGTDVLKALALGARAVLIGRPVFWGLATGGAAGLGAMVELIRGELVSAMALTGATRIADVGRHLVTRRS